MYIALGIMFLGILVGRLLGNKVKFSVSPYIMAVIVLLLFVLGLELGYNVELVSKFASIGYVAVVIAFFAVLSSCVAAGLLYRFIGGKDVEGKR